MLSLLGIIVIAILMAISLLHLYWVLGGRWGMSYAVPTTDDNTTPTFVPGTFATLGVSIMLTLMAGYIAIRLSWLDVELPSWMRQGGIWVLAFIFIARAIGDFRYVGFFKKVKDTDFGRYDTRYYSLLCLFIGLSCLIIGALTA